MNKHTAIGRALIDGFMRTSPDSLSKHLQEHAAGLPAEMRSDCPRCRRYDAQEQSDARREHLDFVRSR